MRSVNFIAKRVLIDKLICYLSIAFAIFGLIFLFWIICTVIYRGMAGFSLALFTAPTSFGGLANALLGQLELVVIASFFGVPFGIMAGVYLSEYGLNKNISNLIRNISDIMMSTPSIVIGAFAYAILVKPLNSYSGWAGSFALAIMMIPVVLKTTDDMLSLVPKTLREASFALGASKYKCITSVVFRAAKNGLLTGVILSVARVAGETAPLLFTSSNSDFFNFNMNEAIPSLSVSIFDFSSMPDEGLNAVAWAGALILAIFVLGVNILGRILIRK
ncbi:phosphate ABC transporter%2C permease protein PstA [Campylobacter hyointestinalis]|uniref:Phosphate transport system permease protein PstA n=1 Tax=Campylobacter hyointestinalis subsp. hyointestinalis TaxID=91352 RepID=A0A9W5F118_CAMHY|nr:phosphate ABC transporter permease PstA [Campylobacter hyointestinalis]CUU89559.1 phosphate ABC transporter%2C permease protein PstA [Campylobacter hyointestinalis subsp. hyointestinalis]CUU92370.1 phosphate ABC transporter%2C permease protein PstA [Campylobacter hyointestinalis]